MLRRVAMFPNERRKRRTKSPAPPLCLALYHDHAATVAVGKGSSFLSSFVLEFFGFGRDDNSERKVRPIQGRGLPTRKAPVEATKADGSGRRRGEKKERHTGWKKGKGKHGLAHGYDGRVIVWNALDEPFFLW